MTREKPKDPPMTLLLSGGFTSRIVDDPDELAYYARTGRTYMDWYAVTFWGLFGSFLIGIAILWIIAK